MTFVLDSGCYYDHVGFSEEPDKLEVIEIRPSHNLHELHRAQILDANVGHWSTRNSLNETEDPAIVRFVGVQLRDNGRALEFDTQNSSLDTVLQNFELEEAYRYTFNWPALFALMPACQTEQSNTLTFSLGMSHAGVAWKYDVTSGRTLGVFWGFDWDYETLWRVTNKTKAWARHPLFLALVVSVMLGKSLDASLGTADQTIRAVEARTRHHGFPNVPSKIAEGDFTSLSQRMSGCAGSLALAERGHKILAELLGGIYLYSQRYYVGDDPGSREVSSGVEDCVEALKRRLKMQKIQLDLDTRRVDIQLTALFHLINQQETRVAIAVAEDSRTLASASKEDSTAMKTIAAVTIVFLPGTFIAALFAMPLFQWDAVGDSKIVSNRFWIYWAVTVPLTFLTLLVWVLWTKRQARMHRSLDKRAREELRSDIEGQRGNETEKKEV